MKYSTTTDEGLQKAAKYGHSTVDYLGLVSWSIITRCSNAAKESFLRIARPVAKNATEPFISIKQKTRQLLDKKAYVDERAKELETRIAGLEARLAELEKHGVRLSQTELRSEVKKTVDAEKGALLRMIVEENKRLREHLER